MATELGKILKKERIDRGWTLNDMANKLGISPAYLSHIEMGRRRAPAEILETICTLFSYHDLKARRLKQAAEESYKTEMIKIQTKNLSDNDHNLVKMFARRFGELSETEKNRMKKILGGDNNELGEEDND